MKTEQHAENPRDPRYSLCGRYWWKMLEVPVPTSAVTCKNCLRGLRAGLGKEKLMGPKGGDRSLMFAVKMSSRDGGVYWAHPGSTKRALFDSAAEARELAEREGGHIVEMRVPKAKKPTEQPPPIPNDKPATWDLVVTDMRARDAVGRERYGTPLQPGNGRNSLRDAYEEALDLCVYLRNALEEQASPSTLPGSPGERWVAPGGKVWKWVGPHFVDETGLRHLTMIDLEGLKGWHREVPTLPHRQAMADEIRRLQAREQELLECNTRLLEERRAAERHQMVREFFVIAGQVDDILERPGVPCERSLRLGLRLVAEEFFELLEAALNVDASDLGQPVLCAIRESPVVVDLPELADAVIDTAYVLEGVAARCGFRTGPLFALVHAANMTKASGPLDEHGKRCKPPGFVPPNVGGELERQGWVGV